MVDWLVIVGGGGVALDVVDDCWAAVQASVRTTRAIAIRRMRENLQGDSIAYVCAVGEEASRLLRSGVSPDGVSFGIAEVSEIALAHAIVVTGDPSLTPGLALLAQGDTERVTRNERVRCSISGYANRRSERGLH